MTAVSSSGVWSALTSTSRCSRRRSSPAADSCSVTRTFIGSQDTGGPESEARRSASGEALEHEVQAACKSGNVAWIDRGVGGHPNLVAAELAVGLRVHDAVGPQRAGDVRCVDGGIEVDRDHDGTPLLD